MGNKLIDPRTIDEQVILEIVSGKNARPFAPSNTTSGDDKPTSTSATKQSPVTKPGSQPPSEDQDALDRYETMFLHPGHIASRKSLHIDADIHRRISALVGAAARNDLTVSGFVNGILTRHFEEYGELIAQFLDKYYQSLKP